MHGIIFSELRNFAEAQLGKGGWDRLTAKAGLDRPMYLAFKSYPDADAVALVGAACALTGLPARSVLEAFGEHLAAPLMQTYGAVVKPAWSIIDLVEHVEKVHTRVRSDPAATPPQLVARRTGPAEVQVTYRSTRMLCGVGVGMVRGLSRVLKQGVSVRETQCMHAGADSCVFVVQAAP